MKKIKSSEAETIISDGFVFSNIYAKKNSNKLALWISMYDNDSNTAFIAYCNLGEKIKSLTSNISLTEFKSNINRIKNKGYIDHKEFESIVGVKLLPDYKKYSGSIVNRFNASEVKQLTQMNSISFYLYTLVTMLSDYIKNYNGNLNKLQDNIKVNNKAITGYNRRMLIQTYSKSNIIYPCFAQPKYNGLSCTSVKEDDNQLDLFKVDNLKKVTLISRDGKEYNMPQISAVLKDLMDDDIYLDGELYLHGMTREEIQSIVTSDNHPKKDDIEFVIYDCSSEVIDMMQDDRIRYINVIKSKPNMSSRIIISETVIINSYDEAVAYFEKCIAEGYEGAVLRNMKFLYTFGKRNTNTAKLKQVKELQLKIVDVVISSTDNKTVKLVLRNNLNDYTWECSMKGNKEENKFYYDNKSMFINKLANIEYRGRTAKNNLPDHAVVTEILDKYE